MYIDSHAHLTSDTLFGDVASIIERAKMASVEAIINICTCPVTMERGIVLNKTIPWIYNTGATTPHDVSKEGEAAFPVFEKYAREGALVAIGETGLDYHYEHSDRKIQKYFLVRYLHLALEYGLPVVIHCRDAFEDLFAILDREYNDGEEHAFCVLHCFTGTLEEALEVVKRGWYLSLSGIVTFKGSDALREVAKRVPLENLLIETDSPYLAPQKYRGKLNEPSYVIEVARLVASLKGLDVSEVAKQTTKNAKKFFGIS